MSKTILQVPLTQQAKKKAEKAALAQGFSSLQEAVRVFLNKLAQGRMEVTFEDTIHLSKRAIDRYDNLLTEIGKGKGIHEATTLNDLMKQLQDAD